MRLRVWATSAMIALLAWGSWAWAGAGEVIEKFPDGKVRLYYHTDTEGRKTGDYVENYENGKTKLRAGYKADKLNGLYTSYWESGAVKVKATYTDGVKNGTYSESDDKGRLLKEQIYLQDKVLYPKTVRIIQATLEGIGVTGPPEPAEPTRPSRRPSRESAPAEVKETSGDPLKDDKNIKALRRLNAYRYLVGLSYDVTLNAKMCELAKAAADICARIGHLDHHPSNPGMSAEQYQKALEGTTHANLEMGRGTRACVDEFMDDSDPSNIGAVGHRRWCLNPNMQEAGFGESGRFSAMYAHDQSRKDVPDYDYVAYPAQGYMPSSYFSPSHAWNVSLNPAKFGPVNKSAVKVAVYPLDPGTPTANPQRRGPAMEIGDFNIDGGGYGIRESIIWRPKGVSLKPGTRYWVEITGLKKADGSATSVEYVVEFIQM